MERIRGGRAVSLDDAVAVAKRSLASTWVSTAQSRRVEDLLEGFVRFARRGFGVNNLSEITTEVARAYIESRLADGTAPSIPLMHLKRSALRLLFRVGRSDGLFVGDPTLDIELPRRFPLRTRPLTDEEVALCRGSALWSLSDTRRAAAWALAEATCRSVELGRIRVADVDCARRRVWIHGGKTTAARWGELSDWAALQLEHRLDVVGDAPTTRIVYGGDGTDEVGQISACVALVDILTRAGLNSEPDVRPASVAAWAGRKILQETGRIDAVARRLGVRSLDRAARFIGWDWIDEA